MVRNRRLARSFILWPFVSPLVVTRKTICEKLVRFLCSKRESLLTFRIACLRSTTAASHGANTIVKTCVQHEGIAHMGHGVAVQVGPEAKALASDPATLGRNWNLTGYVRRRSNR